MRWLIDRGSLGLDDDAAMSWLIYFGRFVSLAMAMATVWLIWGFAVFQELILNPQRFAVHVKLLLGPMSKDRTPATP